MLSTYPTLTEMAINETYIRIGQLFKNNQKVSALTLMFNLTILPFLAVLPWSGDFKTPVWWSETPNRGRAGLITFALRPTFILLVGRMELPQSLRRPLRFVPPAVLSAIIFLAVLMPEGSPALSPLHNARIITAALALLVAWRTKKILPTIAVGMTSFWILQARLGGVINCQILSTFHSPQSDKRSCKLRHAEKAAAPASPTWCRCGVAA